MKISEMLAVINNEAGRPIVKDGEKKILANPCEPPRLNPCGL